MAASHCYALWRWQSGCFWVTLTSYDCTHCCHVSCRFAETDTMLTFKVLLWNFLNLIDRLQSLSIFSQLTRSRVVLLQALHRVEKWFCLRQNGFFLCSIGQVFSHANCLARIYFCLHVCISEDKCFGSPTCVLFCSASLSGAAWDSCHWRTLPLLSLVVAECQVWQELVWVVILIWI